HRTRVRAARRRDVRVLCDRPRPRWQRSRSARDQANAGQGGGAKASGPAPPLQRVAPTRCPCLHGGGIRGGGRPRTFLRLGHCETCPSLSLDGGRDTTGSLALPPSRGPDWMTSLIILAMALATSAGSRSRPSMTRFTYAVST